MTRGVACLWLLLLATPAAAEPVGVSNAEASRGQSIEMRLWSLRARGLALDYERLWAGRVSGAVGVGWRHSARGDYSGRSQTLSLAARYWLVDGAARSWMRGPLAGAYAEAGLDWQRVTLRDEVDDESLATTHTLAFGLALGFRFPLWRRLSVTPYGGGYLRSDVPRGRGRIAIRPTFRYGLRVGALF